MADRRRGANTVDDLLVREEIGDVVQDLARGTDRLDAELIASCYHSDGTDDHNVFRGTGTEFAQWVVDTIFRVDSAPPSPASGNPRVVAPLHLLPHRLAPDVDRSRGHLHLRYVDHFERRDGVWLIATRVCAFDWSVTVPFDPARGFGFEPGWTLGARDRTDITYQEDC